jgi:hypothetical protein
MKNSPQDFYALFLWLAGPIVEALIVRAIRAKWFQQYRLFFSYISFARLQDIAFFLAFRSKYYVLVYWCTSPFVPLGDCRESIHGPGHFQVRSQP